MQKETVDEYIKTYRANLTRCDHLKAKLKMLEADMEQLNREAVTDGVKITNSYSDMPGSHRISDSVGQLAVKLADGIENARQRDCRKEIEAANDELNALYPKVLFVEAWMHAPKPDERFVIEKKLLQEMSWRQVIYAYQREYGVSKSLNGLKSLMKAGMKEIYKQAE